MDDMKQLARRYGLPLCIECGKCVAVCPIWEVFGGFSAEVSPRRMIAWAVRGPEMQSVEHVGVWFCLTCDLCTNLCPAGVRVRDFVIAARKRIIEAGFTRYSVFCRNCGVYLHPQPAVECLKHKLGHAAEELLTLCPMCRRYVFGEKVKALNPGMKTLTLETQMAESRSTGR
jgi:Fe-S oxidoreductase